MHRTLTGLASLFLLFSLMAPSCRAAILRVDGFATGPSHDGATWQTAFLTIQAALDAAQDGDEIWVARTGANQNLVVERANITLTGRFAGYETTGGPQGEAPTTLAGTGEDLPNISITPTATGFRMSGFRVVGASRRGGIRCDATGVVLTENTITGNGVAGGDGGGLVCRPGAEVTISHSFITGNRARHGAGILARNATVSIINNVIEENAASFDAAGQPDEAGDCGGGIAVFGGAALVKNNEIAYNTLSAVAAPNAPDAATAYGAGIAIVDATATIANNTVAFNTVLGPGSSAGAKGAGGGIYFAGSGAVANNIVAANAVDGLGGPFVHGGLAIAPTARGAITITHNLFHDNFPDDAVDFAGANGNISGDPKFAGPGQFFYNFRLQPGSPAIDAGDDAWVQAGDLDQNGSTRIRGAHVDMGAYESVPTAGVPSRVYVRPGGSDAADGASWDTAKGSVTAAVNTVATGGEVWVAEGAYHERVTFRAGITLLGGFSGSEEEATQRDVRAHPTVLDGDHAGTVVTIPAGATSAMLDGFTVRNGGGKRVIDGAGVWSAGADAVVANNVIEDNALSYFEDNPTARGAGVFVGGGSITLRDNVIRNNHVLVANTLDFPLLSNLAAAHGGGVCLADAEAVVVNNLIVGNSAATADSDSSQKEALGGGLYAEHVTGLIANNTVSGSTTTELLLFGEETPAGGAVYLRNTSVGLTLANNIVAFNGSGVMQRDSAAKFYNNAVFGNGTDYGTVNATAPPPANGNIQADPLFVDRASGNFRLAASSPAVDAGSGAYVRTGTDLDGHPRIAGARVDMGPYEFVPLPDAVHALRIAGGLEAAPEEITALNVENGGASAGVVDIADVVALLRAAGR